MHGKVIQFKADIANFKVKDGVVTSQTELLPDDQESKNTDANNK